jgi:SAM-dependent methyltransferase
MRSYDEIAEWYADWVRNTSWAHPLIANYLPMLCGDVDGNQVLDVACGEGIFSRLLAEHGAVVRGIDISGQLIERAKGHAGGLSARVSFSVGDAQMLDGFEDHVFNGAICVMALMDIPDLQAVYAATRRVVRDGGWFVFVITHPCFDSPHAEWLGDDPGGARLVAHYLDEGPWHSHFTAGVRGKVGANHRTLSTYINEALAAGWSLEQMLEPAGGIPNQNPLIPRLLMARFCAAAP